nr:hypothetical protein [uncultured Cohaesibacter sp.]
MNEAPASTLTVGDAVFSFSETNLKVKAGLLQGQGIDDSALLSGREERLEWLWQWSFCLDREREPLQSVSDALDADSILRDLFDYSARQESNQQGWVQVEAMPALSKWAAFVAGQTWLPRRFRASQGKHIHAHRQIMAQWLDGEVQRWEGMRAGAAEEQQTEGPYEAYLGHLRRQIEAGRFSLEVKTAFQALLQGICPLIELVELKSADSDNLILMLKIADKNGLFSEPRHQPSKALDRLDRVQGDAVAEQRLKEVGYRVAILVSEMLQIMHCRRNQVAMAFIMTHHGASKSVFAITFKATLLLTYRSFILSAIGRRFIPDLPICKTLKLHELL